MCWLTFMSGFLSHGFSFLPEWNLCHMQILSIIDDAIYSDAAMLKRLTTHIQGFYTFFCLSM